jgi:hypothetical protein
MTEDGKIKIKSPYLSKKLEPFKEPTWREPLREASAHLSLFLF